MALKKIYVGEHIIRTKNISKNDCNVGVHTYHIWFEMMVTVNYSPPFERFVNVAKGFYEPKCQRSKLHDHLTNLSCVGQLTLSTSLIKPEVFRVSLPTDAA